MLFLTPTLSSLAGTVGGRFVGVSPGANIYGVKVLSDDGSGDVSAILAALDFVRTRVASTGRRSVVSMSLGGPCDGDCSEDSLVIAVEQLVKAHNIVVSVAAGNDGCNACQGSPNAAPSAISVGATDVNDNVAYFSDIGSCIDIFAPGYQIVSACASVMCGAGVENMYAALSGTSMACPHTTGVVAQILQKYPTATPLQVITSMTCDAARLHLRVDSKDTQSRNLLLQIPPLKTTAGSDVVLCDLGAGCDNDCSGAGVCLPWHTKAPLNATGCHCSAGYYGPSCADTEDPYCSSSTHVNLQMILTDSYGDGWTFSNYALTDAITGLIVGDALDSLCTGSEGARSYCVLPGRCYRLDVSRGIVPQEVGWSLCQVSGGAPYSGLFCIDERGTDCTQRCDDGTALVPMQLTDSYGDGWNGAYYNVFSPDGSQLYGGSLPDGLSGINNLCLPMGGCSVIMMESVGTEPSEVGVRVCVGIDVGVRVVVDMCRLRVGVGVVVDLDCPLPQLASMHPPSDVSGLLPPFVSFRWDTTSVVKCLPCTMWCKYVWMPALRDV